MKSSFVILFICLGAVYATSKKEPASSAPLDDNFMATLSKCLASHKANLDASDLENDNKMQQLTSDDTDCLVTCLAEHAGFYSDGTLSKAKSSKLTVEDNEKWENDRQACLADVGEGNCKMFGCMLKRVIVDGSRRSVFDEILDQVES